VSVAARTVTVLYLTDVHARVENEHRPVPAALRGLIPGDADRLTLGLTAIERLVMLEKDAASGGPLLFINCGDLIGIEMAHDWAGGGLVTLAALEAIVERAGIELCYSVVGNHEMDFGVDGFRRLEGAARRFRFLAGNLAIDGAPQSARLEVVNVAGLRIAIVALTVELTRTDAPAADRGRLTVAQPVPAAEAAIAEVRARKASGEIDLAIGAVHLWDDEDVEVAGVEGIDILLGGHSHVFHSTLLGPRAIPYRKAGCHAQALGTVRLERADRDVRVVRSWLLPGVADPTFESRVRSVFGEALARIKEQHPARFREVARVSAPITGIDRIRSRECPIGRLVAEMMLATARRAGEEWVHFAFINGGNVRKDLTGDDGKVLATDLHAVVPFGNEILLVDAGQDVAMRVLHNFVACAMVEPPGFLQFAGIRFRVDAQGAVHDVEVEVPATTRAQAAPGSGTLEARDAVSGVTWCPLASLAAVRMATIDYLVREEGGHHYRFLDEGAVHPTGERLAEAWMESLASETVAGMPPPELSAPGGRCVTIDDGLRHADERAVLATVDASASGRLAWVTERRKRSEVYGVRAGA
jgi:2',3'-cyclic-nucleotide 2'-phosphodiesterase (5'-nucleotidase family)